MNLQEFKTEVKKDIRALENIGVHITHRAYAEAEKLTDDELNMKVTEAADMCIALSHL